MRVHVDTFNLTLKAQLTTQITTVNYINHPFKLSLTHLIQLTHNYINK